MSLDAVSLGRLSPYEEIAITVIPSDEVEEIATSRAIKGEAEIQPNNLSGRCCTTSSFTCCRITGVVLGVLGLAAAVHCRLLCEHLRGGRQ